MHAAEPEMYQTNFRQLPEFKSVRRLMPRSAVIGTHIGPARSRSLYETVMISPYFISIAAPLRGATIIPATSPQGCAAKVKS
jgi:hypothetical protein